MIVVTFKADEDLVEELDEQARIEGKTRSQLIREAIKLYLALRKYHVKDYKRVTIYS